MKEYTIYKGYHGAYFLMNGYTEDGTSLELIGIRTHRRYYVGKGEFEKYYEYVGTQLTHPFIVGVICDEEE